MDESNEWLIGDEEEKNWLDIEMRLIWVEVLGVYVERMESLDGWEWISWVRIWMNLLIFFWTDLRLLRGWDDCSWMMMDDGWMVKVVLIEFHRIFKWSDFGDPQLGQATVQCTLHHLTSDILHSLMPRSIIGFRIHVCIYSRSFQFKPHHLPMKWSSFWPYLPTSGPPGLKTSRQKVYPLMYSSHSSCSRVRFTASQLQNWATSNLTTWSTWFECKDLMWTQTFYSKYTIGWWYSSQSEVSLPA